MASTSDEALQIINQAYQDILIQAGKHFRIIAKDGPGALAGTPSGIQAKTSDSLSQYHLALNEIENEIIQARSVLFRDLEVLRAARAPVPVPAPTSVPAPFSVPVPVQAPTPTSVPVPAPIPPSRLAAPPAPMMELPSAAAHSRNLNPASSANHSLAIENKTVAPFPDMGMGMSTDVVDLTSGEKKPSPRLQTGSMKAVVRSGPPTNIKPSPKQLHKSTPPAKVTPVPPPQIPRLQGFQSSSSNQTKSQPPPPPPQKASLSNQPVQQAPAAKAVQDTSTGSKLALPSTAASDGATASSGNGELNFTDMVFAPPTGESQGAPPAPMPEFDLATFAPQGGNANTNTNANTNANIKPNSNTNANTANTNGNNHAHPSNASSGMDDLFNLGDENGGGDNMFDLGGTEVNDSTFDDMMFFGNNDDMAQFDDAYFGL